MSQKDCRGTTCGVTKVKKTVVCLLLWMSVHQISGQYVVDQMKDNIEMIKQYYNVKDSDIYNNQAVIPKREMKTNNTERKMVYMAGILEAYEKLIDKMLNQLPTPSPPMNGRKQDPTSGPSEAAPDIRQKLKYLLETVQDLKSAHYQEEAKLLRDLQGLKHIKVDNIKLQNKALFDLPLLYEEASSLTSIRMRKRRSRQRKVKIHQRG